MTKEEREAVITSACRTVGVLGSLILAACEISTPVANSEFQPHGSADDQAASLIGRLARSRGYSSSSILELVWLAAPVNLAVIPLCGRYAMRCGSG